MNNLVRRENKDGAAILWLNRPEKLNALTKDVFEALDDHVDAIARETRTIGLVILRGAGANFSAGYDMNEVLERHIKAHARAPFPLGSHPENGGRRATRSFPRCRGLLDRRIGTRVGSGSHPWLPSRRSFPTSMRAGV